MQALAKGEFLSHSNAATLMLFAVKFKLCVCQTFDWTTLGLAGISWKWVMHACRNCTNANLKCITLATYVDTII